MAQKYRKIDPRIWSDEGFVTLTVPERLVAFYLLTTHQGNRIGLFRLSLASAAEDLRMLPDEFEACFKRVLRTFNWKWDSKSRVLFIRTWWKYNRPQNPNTLKSCLDDLHDLPSCPLCDEFLRNVDYLTGDWAAILAVAAENYSTNRNRQSHSRRATRNAGKVAANIAPDNPGNIAFNIAGNITSNIDPNIPPQEQEHKQVQEKKQKETALSFPASLGTSDFCQAWQEWLEYRREAKMPTTQATLKAQLKQLADLGADAAIACLQKSIRNGWQGIFPESAERRKENRPQSHGVPVGPGVRYRPNMPMGARND